MNHFIISNRMSDDHTRYRWCLVVYLPHTYYLQASGDAFSLLAPQLEDHEAFRVFCLQAWNYDEFVVKALQLELHDPYHG